MAEGNRTGDDRPGQTQTGGRIQENIETHLNDEGGEHFMELMSLKQIGEVLGVKKNALIGFKGRRNLKPLNKGKVEGSCKPVHFFDPAPFFEYYANKEKLAEKPTIEEVAQCESVEEYPAMAPPLPILTPELMYAFKEIFGNNGAICVLRNNYGLNDIDDITAS